MSHGVFRTPEKYITAAGEIPDDIFLKADLINPGLRRFLAGGLGFGEEKTNYVRTEIACLLGEIQRASFVLLRDAQRIRTKAYPGTCESDIAEIVGDGEEGLDSSTYITTLDPGKLINIIRLQLMNLLKSCIVYHPDFSAIHSRTYLDANQSDAEDKESDEDGDDVKKAQFLTSESKKYVKAIGGISTENANDIARTFASAVLERSKLSAASFRGDMMDIGRGIKLPREQEHPPRLVDSTVVVVPAQEVFYSTLNPQDLIRMFRDDLQFLGMAIKTRMDKETLETVIAKEKAYDEEHKV